MSLTLFLLKHKFSLFVSVLSFSFSAEEHNAKMRSSYYEEPIKTCTCKLLWTWPLVSIWLHVNIELKPAVCSEPRQNHSCDSTCLLTKDNFRRSEGKILRNISRLNGCPGKLNILHCFIFFVETNTTDRRISFKKNWVSVWVLTDEISSTAILHRKPPNKVICQKATVNWQKKKKGVMIISQVERTWTIQ